MTPFFAKKFNTEITEKVGLEADAILSGTLDTSEYKKQAGYIQGLKDALLLFNEQWEQQRKKEESDDYGDS